MECRKSDGFTIMASCPNERRATAVRELKGMDCLRSHATSSGDLQLPLAVAGCANALLQTSVGAMHGCTYCLLAGERPVVGKSEL